MFCFMAGCFLVDFAWRSSGGPPLQSKLKLHGEYDWVCHFFLSFLAFAYFLVGVVGVIGIAGNLVLLTEDPSRWLSGKDCKVLKYADFFTSGAMVVGLFAVASFKSMNPVRWVRNASRFMVVFTIVLSFMTYPSRGINMLCLGMLVIQFNYFRGRFSWRAIPVATVFICVFFVVVASLKGQYGSYDITDERKTKEMALLLYKYVANNYWNLDYAFNRLSDIPEYEWTYGDGYAKVWVYFLLYFSHYFFYMLPAVQKMPFPSNSKQKICSAFDVVENLEYLGYGEEGVVYCNSFFVYKFFYKASLDGSVLALYEHLKAILLLIKSHSSKVYFNVLLNKGDLFVYYPNRNFSKFREVPLQSYIVLLRQFRSMGIVHDNIRTKNLCVSNTGELLVCDIGKSLMAWSEPEFEIMTMALFTIYKLQANPFFLEHENDFLTRKNLNMKNLSSFLNDSDIMNEYGKFRATI